MRYSRAPRNKVKDPVLPVNAMANVMSTQDDKRDCLAPPNEILVPSIFGEYEIVGRLGGGGMGVVFKAVHRRLKRPEAIKIVRRDRLERPGAAARFLREMEAVGRLNDPHVVTAYGAGEVNGIPYLAMEYVAGCDLGRLVRAHGPLAWPECCQIAYEVSLALDSADQHGVVHRDLKPSNILLTEKGVAKVADLGLAKFYQVETVDLTSADAVVGTADYIAPEQIHSNAPIDIRADIYSLGCTVYFMLAGRPPFGGPDYSSVLQKLRAHAEVPPPSIARLRDDVPHKVARVMACMMEKRPDHRYPNAKALAEALEEFSGGADVAGLVASVTGLPAEDQRARSTVTFREPSTHRFWEKLRFWQTTRRTATVVLAIAVVAAIVAGIAALLPGNRAGTAGNAAEKTFEDLSPAEIRLGQWYNLLNREPEKIIWPPEYLGTHSFVAHRADSRLVHIQSQQLACLTMGRIEHDSFVWRIEIVRPEWTSGTVGLFLGTRQGDGGTTISFQTIEVRQVKSQGKWRFRLERNQLVVDTSSGRPVPGAGTWLCASDIEEPVAQTPITVEIVVTRGVLSGFRWDGKEIPGVTDGRAAATAQPASYKGPFGLLVEGTAIDFDNSQIRFLGSAQEGSP
jgi:eukaryotic-like serine/threonine-protein kinase